MFLFPWEQFALDREQRRCGGGGQWGRWRAGRQQVMCLPPECLHMLCVGGFMAVPPLARIPRWPGVEGHRGALYSWPAGPAQSCHPPAERESYTHTVNVHTHTAVYTRLARRPAQMPVQDNPVGIDASLSQIENPEWGGTGCSRNTMKRLFLTQCIIISFCVLHLPRKCAKDLLLCCKESFSTRVVL